MNLACPSSMYRADSSIMEAVVWSICLIAPIATFLALPKLLPLRRELAWSRVKALWPLARLAAGGDWAALRDRVRAAWRRDVEAAHPAGPRAEVVRDERLLGRARAVGWAVAALIGAAHLAFAGFVLANDSQYTGRFALTLLATGLVMAWIGRVAGAGGALAAQALALGKSGARRLGAGALVGAGYGAVAGFTAGFFGMLVLVPMMSAMTLDAPTSHETMIMLTIASVAAALIGAFVGALLLAPIAVAARRK